KRVLPENVARTTTGILESVIKAGTARVANLGKVRAWGKTGTTENYGDAWFVGATDKLTVAVWVGYPDKLRPMRSEYRGRPVAGGTYPAQIWRDFMVAIIQSEQDRLQRRCDRQEAERKEDERPSKRCVEAGLATDPTTTTPAPEPEAPVTTTSKRSPRDNEGGRATGDDGGTQVRDRDGATRAPPQAPAAPPDSPVAPPAQPAPAPGTPPAPGESGGIAPQP
ncbi:MAG TPA: hypothetical protein VNT54_02855, partial [Solirubrobacteraceae bacterium]|nr:hypothetical protein [Solirubrobacteraceae bacterium]